MKGAGINDIAEKVGLSRNTVSKVLNNRGEVAEETKNRIIEAAISLGYKKVMPEWIEERKVKNILVIVTAPDFSSYWGQMIHGITNKMEEEGYHCFYHFLTFKQVKEFTISDILNTNTISGIIVMNVYNNKAIDIISECNIPAVYFDLPRGYDYQSARGDIVIAEGSNSIERVTNQVIKKGAESIGFIGDVTYCESIRERWFGFIRAMNENNLEIDDKVCLIKPIKDNFYVSTEIEEHLEKLIEKEERLPEAWVCANDAIASRVIRVFEDKGYRVPENVKITGFDDVEDNDYTKKLAVTVRVGTEDIGRRLAEQIIWRIGHKERQYEIIKIIGEVIER